LNTIQWVFSGIGVLALVLLGRLGIFLWKKWRPSSNPLEAPDTSSLTSSKPRFTRPTPDEMTRQVEALPPFQQRNAEKAYRDLQVCWQALFLSIREDEPANKVQKETETKKWIVYLKHYDPSIDYANGQLLCPGIELEKYPELKTMHTNELVTVTGTIGDVSYMRVLVFDAEFEFSGTWITKSKRFRL
jgi:hypothetical protein